jgi:hypothetical protein
MTLPIDDCRLILRQAGRLIRTIGNWQSSGLAMLKTNLVRSIFIFALTFAVSPVVSHFDSTAQTRRKPAKHPAVCGNPNVTCASAFTFEAYDLPFRMPRNAVIYDTDLFYAVILKSVPSPADNCDNYIPEPDRLAAQVLFPNNKVFTSRCAEPGRVSYSNTSAKAQFMAVYAGMTLAEANSMLAKVKAAGKFPGANVRRMRAMVNGT